MVSTEEGENTNAPRLESRGTLSKRPHAKKSRDMVFGDLILQPFACLRAFYHFVPILFATEWLTRKARDTEKG